MRQDRFLMAILAAIVLLAIVALGLFITRQQKQEYGAGKTPQDVVRNYALALHKRDYERAYSYLKEGKGKPTLETFRQQYISHQMDPANTSLVIGTVETSGEQVWVSLTIQRGQNDLFAEIYRENATAYLEKDAQGNWKLSSMPYPYWGWDWYQPDQSPVDQPGD